MIQLYVLLWTTISSGLLNYVFVLHILEGSDNLNLKINYKRSLATEYESKSIKFQLLGTDIAM